jgi:hypothetical protein
MCVDIRGYWWFEHFFGWFAYQVELRIRRGMEFIAVAIWKGREGKDTVSISSYRMHFQQC